MKERDSAGNLAGEMVELEQEITGGSTLDGVSPSVPELFDRLRSGDQSALNPLIASLYQELHRIAARHLRRERPEHTLQPTALVHEAYLKLFDSGHHFTGKAHFLAVASRVMRQVLVDYARSEERRVGKR